MSIEVLPSREALDGLEWSKGDGLLPVVVQDADSLAVGVDCDNDPLLVSARPAGPTCHTGSESCFERAPGNFLGRLDAFVRQREQQRPAVSYTTALFDGEIRRIAQKVGEEGVETALAGVVQDDAALLGESADLLFHLIVLLRARGLSLADAVAVLAARHAG